MTLQQLITKLEEVLVNYGDCELYEGVAFGPLPAIEDVHIVNHFDGPNKSISLWLRRGQEETT